MNSKPRFSLLRLFHFQPQSSSIEHDKVKWLIYLRWLAVAFYFLATLPLYLMGFLDQNTIVVYVGILCFIFLFNFLSQMFLVRPQKDPSPFLLVSQISMDLMILSTLILLTGLLNSPFIGFFFVHSVLAGFLIRSRISWPFVFLAHALMATVQIIDLQENTLQLSQNLSLEFIKEHLILFILWFLSRQIGLFLESQFVNNLNNKIQLEKQDRLRALGALAAGFSHEFASPLNAARLRLDRLSKDFSKIEITKEMNDNLSEAQSSIQACEDVIRSMNSAQLDVRTHRLKKIKLKDFIHDIVDSWKEINSDFKIEMNLLSEETVQTSPINFAQVIFNLLDNAMHVSKSHRIEVYLSSNDKMIELSFTDDGPGFPPNYLDRQYEPFYTTKKNGTGLGLYVSGLFAQSLGGQLEIKNLPTAGAQVSLIWPLKSEEDRKEL